MAHPREADLEALIGALEAAGVEFLVVGGVAAVLHGAGVMTLDLDVVPRKTPENAARLVAALADLDGRLQDPMGRVIRPSASDFQGQGQVKLSTALGPLDVLCRLHDGRGYDELVDHTVRLGHDPAILVLDLATLLEVKASTGRAKDRLVVPLLLALLEEDS